MAADERIYPGIDWNLNSKIYKEHAARYEFASKFVLRKKVLDVACGSGYGSKILCDGGASSVIGCDLEEEAIQFAKKNYTNEIINFQVMDATKITFKDNSFDCVVSFETIEHIPNYQDAIFGFYRILKDDGILIISTPNKEIVSKGKNKPTNPFHIKEFTKDEFLGLLQKYFSQIQLFSQRLQIDISVSKKILRNLILVIVKCDILKLHIKFRKQTIYYSMSDLIDNTVKQYDPIPYQNIHKPMVFIAICKK